MLTPIDIQNKDFDVKFRGYDTDEVDDFFDLIAADYEMLYKENKRIKEKLRMSEEQMEKYRTMETTLQNSIILAQSTSEEIRANANEKAENIIQQAQLQADEIIKKASADASVTKNELSSLQVEVQQYKAQLKSICASLAEMVDRLG